MGKSKLRSQASTRASAPLCALLQQPAAHTCVLTPYSGNGSFGPCPWHVWTNSLGHQFVWEKEL